MITGRLLARNSFLNLGTGGLILVLNIVFVPVMLRSFGLELYGVLAVTWMVLGHLRWLDLGFSTACARYVAQDVSRGNMEQAQVWAWTAVAAQALIGALAALGLWIVAPALVDLLRVQETSSELVVLALRLFALVVPLELASRSLNGVLEGLQRFDWINGLTLFGAAWTYGVYTIGVVGGDFRTVLYGLMALKAVQLVATFWAASRTLPSLVSFRSMRIWSVLDRARLVEMVRFGGWVSVSTAIGPALLYFDRWVISTVRGVAVLPLYTVPLNLLMSLSVLPASIASTLFPAFSAMEARMQWDRVEEFFIQAHRYLLLILAPLFCWLFVWAPELLRLWIDADFAAAATAPLRVLIIGFGIGLFAPLSGVLLQGAGRPDLLSKIYLVELPFNVLLTLFLIRGYGILGAAIALTVRTAIETVVLWVVIARVLPVSPFRRAGPVLRRPLTAVAVLIAATFFLPAADITDLTSVAATATLATAYVATIFLFLLNPADRQLLRDLRLRALGRSPEPRPTTR
jgi:O-antigen/teichoic acid export membrane protein